MRYLRVVAWGEFQHYKNRRAPWIKVATALLDPLEHPTFAHLTDGAKLTLHHLRLLAGVTGNQIPESWLTSGHLNMQTKPRVTELLTAKFIEWTPDDEVSSLANRTQKDNSGDAPNTGAARARGRARSQPSQDSPSLSSEEEKNQLRTGARELVEAFVVTEKHRAWAAQDCPLIDVDAATAAWRDYLRQNGYRTRQGPVRDVDASWRNWMRNEVKFSRERNGNRNEKRAQPFSFAGRTD